MPANELRPALVDVVVESAPNAIIVVDVDGTIVLVNRQSENLFGYSREELLGQQVDRLVPERFRGQHPKNRSGFMAAPQQRAMGAGRDLFGLRKDGSEVPIEIGLTPVRTPQGAFVLSAIVDITERKRAEERFRIAVEASPNAMVMVDSAGRIVLVNGQTEQMFGYTRAELLGQMVDVLVPKRLRQRHPEFRRTFFGSPSPRPMGAGRDLYGLRKDRTEIPVEIGLSPIETDEGMMVLSAIVEITERKKAEQILSQQAEELARSNAELEQFAYVASHDLQEPLRAVAGCLQILERRLEGRLGERDAELVAHAVEGASRMQNLIDGLLALSRVGTRGDVFREVDLNDALRTACANLSSAIAETGAAIEVGELPRVTADRTQMVQLFQNLLGNALRYRSDRGAEIEIGARQTGRDWLLWVKDNGIGIERQYWDRIFRVFQRLHTRQQYPGTGIGLSICQKIVERHGGRIWLESIPGEGTTFFFSLREEPVRNMGPTASDAVPAGSRTRAEQP
jgi:PAS domain S-box-containing protein